MCTLTWLFQKDGYTLLFNRDELKTRKRALPPAIYKADNGVSYLAPIDTDAGGTWLASNAFGITICLLNNYRASEPASLDAIRSRGEVVKQLSGVDSLQAAEKQLAKMSLTNYRGFRLVIFSNGVSQWSWDTKALKKMSDAETKNPITSSSFDEVNVQKTRRSFFAAFGENHNVDDLLHFHSLHIDDELCDVSGEPIAVSSVCMHRQLSQTVSQCKVEVTEKSTTMTYTDGAPCVTKSSTPVSLIKHSRFKDRLDGLKSN